MDEAIPDWLLIGLGVLADLAVLYGGFWLVRGWRRRRSARSRSAASQSTEPDLPAGEGSGIVSRDPPAPRED